MSCVHSLTHSLSLSYLFPLLILSLSLSLSLPLSKGETVAHNRVDKFIDVLLTKGPKAIGIFHESLGKTYPGVFDYLTRLFASAGIDLPETRRSKTE